MDSAVQEKGRPASKFIVVKDMSSFFEDKDGDESGAESEASGA